MTRAEELIHTCAAEVATLCENTGVKLAALGEEHDVSALAIAMCIATLAADNIEAKLQATPAGQAYLDKVRKVVETEVGKKPVRKLDS